MIRFSSLRLLLCLSPLLALVSCEYKDLCYDHSHVVDVRIDYDWSKAPDAKPSGMSAYFFEPYLRKSFPERYDFTNPKGGTIRLESGDYQLLGVNYDTETILFRGTENVNNFEAYTRTSSLEEGTQISSRTNIPKAQGTDHQNVVLEPEMLWGGRGDDLSISWGQEGAHATITPEPRVTHCEITLTNVPNLQYTNQFGGSVSGLAGGINIVSGELSDEQVIIPFPVRQVNDSTLVAEFNMFGHCPHADEGSCNEHLFTLYAVLADGSKWYYTADVSNQMHDPILNPDKEQVIIILEDPPVPKPIVNGSGFHPDIDGWDGVDIEVGM